MTKKIEKQALNRAEAAMFLGIAQGTLVKLISNGKIRCIQVGRRKIFSVCVLEAFLRGE